MRSQYSTLEACGGRAGRALLGVGERVGPVLELQDAELVEALALAIARAGPSS